jgi:hypothetical protein
MIKRTLGRKITVPLGARRVGIPIVFMALLLCCCCPLTLVMVDSGLRSAGLLPTYTPRPTAQPTVAPVPIATRPAPTAVPVRVATISIGGGSAFTCIGGCAVAPDPSCAIKGNVNSDQVKIYHTPGQRDYNRTDIKPEEGDRWFCTEAEAQAAGFRHAQR